MKKVVKDNTKVEASNKGLANYIGSEFVLKDGSIIGIDSIREAKDYCFYLEEYGVHHVEDFSLLY